MSTAIKCLLVDDDPDDQEIFTLCLAKIETKVDCKTANNGVEAIDMLESDQGYLPDVIFLDVNMPKMNGIECLRRIRQLPRLAQSKIYVYSTTSEKQVVKTCEELGANDYIVKPSKTNDLLKTLSGVFGNIVPENHNG